MREALARKYRPKRFRELIGQKASRSVLAKMVAEGNPAQAMIFAGVRGTGKTSLARIFARAVNCGSLVDGFEPCWECEFCVTKDPPWIVEVDAATYGGAAQLREIVEDALYSSGDRWRVYVLDEVHSVSQQGFQVLLKTLEEPPPRTSFILVTTEPEKIPDTIQTRAMMFRFQKITRDELERRIVEVAMAEQIVLGQGAAPWIAEAADGGVRDALMLLDQASRLDREMTPEYLEAVFGVHSPAPWIEALLSGNPAQAIVTGQGMIGLYGSVATFVDKALVFLRDCLMVKALGRELTQDHARIASRLSQEQILKLISQVWTLRIEIGKYGVTDQAALAALAAELVRHPVVEREVQPMSAEEAERALMR